MLHRTAIIALRSIAAGYMDKGKLMQSVAYALRCTPTNSDAT